MEVQYRGSGIGFYEDREYNCELYYNDQQGGVVIKVIYMEGLGSYLELPLEMDWWFGRLENGFRFTLFQLVRTNMENQISYGRTVYTYEAEYIFCGIGDKEQQIPTFNEAYYTLSDIIEWGGISVYEVGKDNELAEKGSEECLLYKDTNVSVFYVVSGSFLPFSNHDLLKEEIKLEQHGNIIIRTSGQEDFSYFNSIFQKIQKLVEIASIRKINIEKEVFLSDDIFDTYKDHKSKKEIKVYGQNISVPNNDETKTPMRILSWITLSEIMKNHCMEHFFTKYSLLEPILELYQELLYVPSSNRKKFLNVVQALETYHSRFISNDSSKYKKHIDTLIKTLPQNIRQETKKYLLPGKFGIKLESRIADLLYANHEFIFDTGDIKKKDFPGLIARTRNYYIHYDERIKDKGRILSEEELGIYNNVLFSILDYYLLKELGYEQDQKTLREKLIQRWGNITQHLDLLKQFKGKEDD